MIRHHFERWFPRHEAPPTRSERLLHAILELLERHFHPVPRVRLVVNGISFTLKPNGAITLTTPVGFGQKITYALEFDDQNEKPMATTPTVDAPPVWTAVAPATGTLVVASDGLTAVYTPADPGQTTPSDTVTVVAMVAGVSFTATDTVNVQADPVPVQTLTSLKLVPTVGPA